MKIKQLSIFLENKAGRLREVTEVLGRGGINIRALTLADTADFGVLRLIVDDPAEAVSLIRESGFTVTITDVLAIEVPDKPGGLAGVLSVLDEAGINVEYMYAFVEKTRSNAVMIFRFDNLDGVIEKLSPRQLRVLKQEEVLSL